jgi:hypothetical protein
MNCLLHTYTDGSQLFTISARALSLIPIWKGNRIVDLTHVQQIKDSIKGCINLLDSGYKIIKYTDDSDITYEDSKTIKTIMQSFIIDGQHRLMVLKDYFETTTFREINDFQVTVTEIRVDSETEAIEYFNRINNTRPIRFEEDINLIINKYIECLIKEFSPKMKLFRTSATKRPFLSVDKFREALQKRADKIKLVPIASFVEQCKSINRSIIQDLESRSLNEKDKDIKMIHKMIELEFALAWDDKFCWLDILKS